MSEPEPGKTTLGAFLDQYWKDREEGCVRRLDDYIAEFPGDAAAIAREYFAVQDEPASQDEGTKGEKIGPYRIIEELGHGGQGVVYLAEDGRLRRQVALKVLTAQGVGSKDTLARFQREAKVAARLNHPCLCTVYEAGVEGQVPFIAMEVVDGPSLKDVITTAREKATAGEVESTCILLPGRETESPDDEERPVTGGAEVQDPSARAPRGWTEISTILQMFEDVARALHVMHEGHVLHRDIKPGNIMVRGDGRPVIMDFGLARDEDSDLPSLTQSGDFFGTPEYMSPEQLTRQTIKLDRRTDVWSLGVTLYEALTLKRPFTAATRQALFKAIMGRDPPNTHYLNPDIPRDLRVVLETALEKSLFRRYQTALDLAEELRRVREHEPIVAKPVGPWGRTVRWAQRNPAVAALLVGLIMVLVAGTVSSLAFAFRAEANATEATREKVSVFRLRAFQTLAGLQLRADDDLWPLALARVSELPRRIETLEAWLRDARALISGLTEPDPETGALSHRDQLAELRRRALPQSEAEREADRRSHDRWGELQALQGKRASWRRAQALREGSAKPEPYPLDESSLASDASGLNELAWPMVDPDRKKFGREVEGLALARRAVELPEGKENASILDTLAWALFANGLDKEAEDAMERAVEAAPNARRRQDSEESQMRLEDLIQAWSKAGTQRLLNLESELAALDQEVSRRQTFTFASEDDRWWHAQVVKLVKELERFSNAETGLISGISPDHGWGIERRLDHVRTLRRRTLLDQATAWEEARSRIARNPRYSGLTLAPQLGLVPLGPDPDSTLEEFAETATGDPPKRDPEMRKLELTEQTGLVFVLIPGGTFMMGAQSSDPAGPNHDSEANPDESPPHQVTLAPFLMSKYEMTQGQWERFTGANPSSYKPGTWGGKPVTLLNPVEQVTWEDCERALMRLGLLLPTESQWEYGCRAGTTTPWWCGKGGLVRSANLADRHLKNNKGHPSWQYEEWSDGYTVHAPAGTFDANGFGLHDVHGNVWEWCRDGYGGAYGNTRAQAGDGLREMAGASDRVDRGGCFISPADDARSSARGTNAPGYRYYRQGVRPSQSITP